MKHRNWFWGILFLLAAVFLIASQTTSFREIGALSILATVLLALVIIHSIVYRNFFGIFIPIALLYMVYTQPLQLIIISPWLLISAAILASTGFSIIFRCRPQKSMHDCHHGMEHVNHTAENMDDNHPYAKVSFGASSKYLHADCLKEGEFYVSFGALELYLDQARLSPDGAKLFLDCSFGAIKLYVPRSWQVQDNLHATLGGVDNDLRAARPDADSPVLTLNGNIQFSGVEIRYI